MSLRQALAIQRTVQVSENRKLALLCSFEPLHLKTFLQARLAEAIPADPPLVVTFGYDALESAFRETAQSLSGESTLLIVSWEDLHPQLTWRTRGPLTVDPGEVRGAGQVFRDRLCAWLDARKQAETYIAVAPSSWLPAVDPVPVGGLGTVKTTAIAAMSELIAAAAQHGARVVDLPLGSLDFRDLLAAGCPLSPEASERVATAFTALAYRMGERKKVLVVDLDGTLWGGVIGEDGPGEILHGPSGPGFSFHVFQKVIKRLHNEGVLIAFCSKNNADDVLPAFDKLDMPVKRRDFAAYRCNWESKVTNLVEISKELNVGIGSLVFIDDNPVEVSQVMAQLPEITALRTPQTADDWPSFFENLQALFATWQVLAEDHTRNDFFIQSAQRPSSSQKALEVGGFRHLKQLELRVVVQEHAFDDPRSLELINKTNQFNLTGERMSSSEWASWTRREDVFCVSARLTDRYGDFGTIALITGSLPASGDELRIRQMVLSCRAFGRGVMELLFRYTLESRNAKMAVGPFVDTTKNIPARNFLRDVGCEWPSPAQWAVHLSRVTAVAERIEADGSVNISNAGSVSLDRRNA